jgi:alpha-mannosidase
MNSKESSEFSGIFDRELPAVRIIEDGDVICVVEALFYYHNSFLRIEYRLYKKFNDIDISVDLFWNEKNKLLKLCIPTTVKGDFIGQTAFGQNVLPQNGKEAVAQKWVAIKNEQQTVALINNCSYAFSSRENEIAVTFIRGVAYSALPIYDRDITSRNRFTSRMDQGERNFHYKLTAGKTETVCNCMDFKAQLFNEKPYAFNAFPSGEGEIPQRCLKISNQSIILVAFKQSEDGRYIARLHNNSQNSCETELVSDKFGINTTLQFGKFEVKTIRMWNENWEECTSMEI